MAYKKIDITEIVSSVATLERLLAGDYHSKKDEMVKDILEKLTNDQFVVDDDLRKEVLSVVDALYAVCMEKCFALKQIILGLPEVVAKYNGHPNTLLPFSDIDISKHVGSTTFPTVMIKAVINQMLASGELKLDFYFSEHISFKNRDISIRPYFEVAKKD